VNFAKLPKGTKLPDKSGFELKEKRRADSCPPTNPVHKLSVTSMVWDISPGLLGWLAVCGPSQLLHTCLLAEYEKLEKVLDLIATTEDISVINILLILSPKHSSYWEES